MDKAIIGYCRIGYFRIGVFTDDWNILKKRFESIASCDITRRRLSLTSRRDATTGWYDKEYVESTAEGLLVPRLASNIASAAGTYVRLDAVLLTPDPFEEGDEIKTKSGEYYEIKSVKPYYLGESFWYRECQLVYLPLHGLFYSAGTPNTQDARYRTKVYWETYVDVNRLNENSFIVCYDSPDYPFPTVFKQKAVDIIFAVGEPNSAPVLGHDLVPRRYREHVPTSILTLDTKLAWLAESELRRVTETYPEGTSQRLLEASSGIQTRLGSPTLYEKKLVLDYWRGTS